MQPAIREVNLEECELLSTWANYLQGARYWGNNADSILHELCATELRLCAYVDGDAEPVAYASITPRCPKEYPRQDGALWLDHLFVAPRARGKNLMLPLYQRQLFHVRHHPERRIFRLPVSDRVVQFSLKRGWRYHDDVPDMPFGIYELPRECLA